MPSPPKRAKIRANMALDDRPERYPFPEIEARWQKVWAESKQFKVAEAPGRPKYYLSLIHI